jgi:hypothetical protein
VGWQDTELAPIDVARLHAAGALVGAVVVATLLAGVGSASQSLRPAAAPFGCTNAQAFYNGQKCLWVAPPGRFAYCGYYFTADDTNWMLCVSPVSGNWVRMSCCGDVEAQASYGRDRRLLGVQRRAEVVRGEWFSDRPSDAIGQCRANARFFICTLNYEIAVWFKPDGSFALLRGEYDSKKARNIWKLEARG